MPRSVSKRAKKKALVGPICPGCGQEPYDLVTYDKLDKGPALKRTIWFCPSVVCNPEARVMRDEEVWPASS